MIEPFIKRSRTNLACKKLLRGIQRMYGYLPSVAITDGGPWYLVLRRYGIEHKIVSGGIRNYVERLIERTGQGCSITTFQVRDGE